MLKISKKIIQKYNNPETLLVVSLYPKKGEVYSTGTSGVASYAKNLISNMNRKIIVFSDYDKKPSLYEEENTLVIRCFKQNRFQMWKEIFSQIKTFTNTSTILIQFDFSIYGSILTSGLLLPFLFLLKISGFKASVISHHVILDVRKLSGHVGLGQSHLDQVKASVYNIFFNTFFFLLGLASHQIIVLEETLKKRLNHVISEKKIVAIAHPVDTSLTPIEKSEARKQLGIPMDEEVVVFFGFVNWFKGADFFAHAFQDTDRILDQKARFILAGGESVTMNTKPFYRTYFAETAQTIKNSKNMTMTGYVPQEMIPLYFSAADLIVFPYRHYMCASGVLSLVFSYQKPFIISSPLSEMLDSPDLSQAMKTVHLLKEDLIFTLDKESCLSVTERVLRNGLKQKMIDMTKIVREERSFLNTSQLYENVLFEDNTVISPTYAYEK